MITEVPALHAHEWPMDDFGWTLRATYRVARHGRPARGAVRAMGSDCYEPDPGEGTTVEIITLEIVPAFETGFRPFPVALASIPSRRLEALHAECAAEVDAP